jgi:long-chain acyl-CoA synthetase
VRRGHIAEKYASLVDALYSGRTSCFVETQMRFEDGRLGTVSADLRILEAKSYAPESRKAA